MLLAFTATFWYPDLNLWEKYSDSCDNRNADLQWFTSTTKKVRNYACIIVKMLNLGAKKDKQASHISGNSVCAAFT